MELLTQNDPRWKDVKIGKSKYTIGEAGCVLTSLCNVANIYGPAWWTPDDLNKRLTAIDGYDDGCVRWNAAAKILGCHIDSDYRGSLDFNSSQQFYIAKYKNLGSDHFTNIFGRCGNQYILCNQYILYDVYSGQVIIKTAAEIERIIKLWW